MEQEQQNENLDSTPPKKNILSFFDAVRIKHIILFLLCLLFLGVLIGGGSNERPAKRLAIKNKKSKTHKKDSSIYNTTSSTENLATKSKEKIGKIGKDIKCKTDNTIEKANTSLKQGQEKIGDAIENTSTGIKKGTKGIGDLLTGKRQKLKESNEEKNSKLDKTKPKLDENSNSLAKGLSTDNEKKANNIDETEVEAKNGLKQNNINTAVNSNKASNSKSMESEIELLKKEISQLKNRIDKLNTTSDQQNETTTSSNDMNFINKRIEFWQSVRDNAEIKE